MAKIFFFAYSGNIAYYNMKLRLHVREKFYTFCTVSTKSYNVLYDNCFAGSDKIPTELQKKKKKVNGKKPPS